MMKYIYYDCMHKVHHTFPKQFIFTGVSFTEFASNVLKSCLSFYTISKHLFVNRNVSQILPVKICHIYAKRNVLM